MDVLVGPLCVGGVARGTVQCPYADTNSNHAHVEKMHRRPHAYNAPPPSMSTTPCEREHGVH